MCDDPRLIGAAAQLLGGPVIPECPEGVLCFFEAGWRTDNGIGVPGVKFTAYFGQLTTDNRALRLARSEAGAAACRYPVWRDWLADAAAHPRRAGVIERMRHAGVLDLPGARDGW